MGKRGFRHPDAIARRADRGEQRRTFRQQGFEIVAIRAELAVTLGGVKTEEIKAEQDGATSRFTGSSAGPGKCHDSDEGKHAEPVGGSAPAVRAASVVDDGQPKEPHGAADAGEQSERHPDAADRAGTSRWP